MNVGTKSLLFGVHQFALHPILVAMAWWKLYGFPWDPRLWVAFVVHDWGYWGKPNMDGPEGDTHPELGASIMAFLFDGQSAPGTTETITHWDTLKWTHRPGHRPSGIVQATRILKLGRWGRFTLLHSRFYAKQAKQNVSRLCIADKYVPVLMPWWIYLSLGLASGELAEYMAHCHGGKYDTMNVGAPRAREWHRNIQDYLRRWVEKHRDGQEDTETPASWEQPAKEVS